VTAVSVLEGLARAIAVKHVQAEGSSLEDAYKQLRWKKPVEMLTEYVLPSLGKAPEDAFDGTSWSLIPEAVEFRNLIVHEATYLSGGTCNKLISAVLHVFDRIADLSGAKS
jgi:hypothetical protein